MQPIRPDGRLDYSACFTRGALVRMHRSYEATLEPLGVRPNTEDAKAALADGYVEGWRSHKRAKQTATLQEELKEEARKLRHQREIYDDAEDRIDMAEARAANSAKQAAAAAASAAKAVAEIKEARAQVADLTGALDKIRAWIKDGVMPIWNLMRSAFAQTDPELMAHIWMSRRRRRS